MLARRQRQFWPRGGRAEPATTGLADVVKNKPQYGDILQSSTVRRQNSRSIPRNSDRSR